MTLKSRLLGLAAVVALSLSVAMPALAVDTNTNATAPVTVTLYDNGAFAVSIVGANLSTLNVNAALGGTVTGDLCLRYDDTKTYRGQFHTQLQASDFTSNVLRVPASRANAGDPYEIAASNFEVTRNFDVFAGRWSSWALANLGYEIGDIGVSSSGTDDNYSSGEYSGTPMPAVGCQGLVNTGAANIKNQAWTSGALSSKLDVNQIVGFGFAGPGTAGNALGSPITWGSLQLIKTSLVVPAGQPADTYTSTLTATVTFTGP